MANPNAELLLEKSRRGHFGFEELQPGIMIPYTYRSDRKLCVLNVFLLRLKVELLGLSDRLWDIGFLTGFHMHPDEKKLWLEICAYHDFADIYRTYHWNEHDILVPMESVREVFKFATDCRRKLELGNQTEIACGMLRILMKTTKEEIVLPFISKNGHRYVPSQFPNVPDTLKASVMLSNIDVLYMLFALDVLNVDIPIKNYQMPCVLLDEVVMHIIKSGNNIECWDNYWPSVNNNQSNKEPQVEPNSDVQSNVDEGENEHHDENKEHDEDGINEKDEGENDEKEDDEEDEAERSSIIEFETVEIAEPELIENESIEHKTSANPLQNEPIENDRTEPEATDPNSFESETTRLEITLLQSTANDSSSKDSSPNDSDEPDLNDTVEIVSETSETHETAVLELIETEREVEKQPRYYEIEYIVDYKKKKNGEEMILIHWKGFPSENESWEPVSDFEEEVLENLAAFRKDWASKHSPMFRYRRQDKSSTSKPGNPENKADKTDDQADTDSDSNTIPTSSLKQKRNKSRGAARKPKKFKKTAVYEVEYLVDYKIENGKEKALVHWKEYPSNTDSWEPVEHLNSALYDELDRFRENWALKKKTKVQAASTSGSNLAETTSGSGSSSISRAAPSALKSPSKSTPKSASESASTSARQTSPVSIAADKTPRFRINPFKPKAVIRMKSTSTPKPNDLTHYFETPKNKSEDQVANSNSTTEQTPITPDSASSSKSSKTQIPTKKRKLENSVEIAKQLNNPKKSKPATDEEEYFVEYIVDYKKERGKEWFKVHWKGYGSDADTWEPYGNLNDAARMEADTFRPSTSHH